MVEGFWTSLHRSWLIWTGWLFTVAGTVFGLLTSGAFAWLGALCAVSGLLTLTTFAYQLHQKLNQTEERHASDRGGLEKDLRAAQERAVQAEQKLNEVPLELLFQLEATIRRHAFEDLAAALSNHVGYVERMVALDQALARPVTVRTFVKRAGELYGEAKLAPEAMGHLRQDDLFLLEFKNSNGLVTVSGLLRLHQLEVSKGLVWYQVVRHSGEEMDDLSALADKQDVPGKGYTARPVCDTARYSGSNLAGVTALIGILTEEIARLRE